MSNCCICFDEIESDNEKKLDCEHVYHKKCIDKWGELTNSCPMCRKPIDSTKPTKTLNISSEEDDRALARRLTLNDINLMQLFIMAMRDGGVGGVGLDGLLNMDDDDDDDDDDPHPLEPINNNIHNDCQMVGCASCGGSMCFDHDNITNCIHCGEMYYCSIFCEIQGRRNHNCEQLPQIIVCAECDNTMNECECDGIEEENVESDTN